MAEATSAQEARFDVKRIYVKDISFESPQAPQVFSATDFAPRMNIQLNIEHKDIGENFYEVILTVTVDAKSANEETIFLVEVQQAGVFEVSGIQETEFPLALEVAAPNIMLPFAREVIADIVQKGGFPQLLLSPVNFEALYKQKQEKPATS